MQQHFHFDAIVIGLALAVKVPRWGWSSKARVAVIERYNNVGGGCTHWGTIPSKALRHAVSRIIEFNQNPLQRQCQNHKILFR